MPNCRISEAFSTSSKAIVYKVCKSDFCSFSRSFGENIASACQSWVVKLQISSCFQSVRAALCETRYLLSRSDSSASHSRIVSSSKSTLFSSSYKLSYDFISSLSFAHILPHNDISPKMDKSLNRMTSLSRRSASRNSSSSSIGNIPSSKTLKTPVKSIRSAREAFTLPMTDLPVKGRGSAVFIIRGIISDTFPLSLGNTCSITATRDATIEAAAEVPLCITSVSLLRNAPSAGAAMWFDDEP